MPLLGVAGGEFRGRRGLLCLVGGAPRLLRRLLGRFAVAGRGGGDDARHGLWLRPPGRGGRLALRPTQRGLELADTFLLQTLGCLQCLDLPLQLTERLGACGHSNGEHGERGQAESDRMAGHVRFLRCSPFLQLARFDLRQRMFEPAYGADAPSCRWQRSSKKPGIQSERDNAAGRYGVRIWVNIINDHIPIRRIRHRYDGRWHTEQHRRAALVPGVSSALSLSLHPGASQWAFGPARQPRRQPRPKPRR